MFNARRSALYVAIIGLGFAAGNASAACPAGTKAVSSYTAGYKTTICVTVGSEVVDVTVQPAIDGGEGLLSPVVSVTMEGSSETGFTPSGITLLSSLSVISPTAKAGAKPPKPPKPPKQQMCTILVPDDDGDDDGDFDKKKVPCAPPPNADPLAPPNLVGNDGTLTSPDASMKCNGKKVCETSVEILPTGFICADTGTPALDFTAKPTGVGGDNTFILTVDITSNNAFNGTVTELFGCYALAGKQYSCEAFTSPNPDFELGCSGSAGGYVGSLSGTIYCPTGSLPAGDLLCAI